MRYKNKTTYDCLKILKLVITIYAIGGKKLFSRTKCLLSFSRAELALFTAFLHEPSGGRPVKQIEKTIHYGCFYLFNIQQYIHPMPSC